MAKKLSQYAFVILAFFIIIQAFFTIHGEFISKLAVFGSGIIFVFALMVIFDMIEF